MNDLPLNVIFPYQIVGIVPLSPNDIYNDLASIIFIGM